jgi:hypothetical protein
MAVSSSLFNSVRKYLGDGTIDWDTDTINLALLLSTYTFDATHTIWANMSTYEAAAGAGYTSGGIALASKAVTVVGATAQYTAANPTWAALTKTFRAGVVYKVGTANGIVNPVICCIVFDTTPADIVVTAADFTVQWNANGVFRIT